MQLAAAAAVGGCRGLHGCRGPELWRLRRSLVRLPSCGGLSAGESGSEQAPGQQTPPVPWRSAARAMHSYHQLTQRCIHKKSFHSSCSRLFARSSQAPATNTVTNTATNTVTNTMTVTGADTAVIGVSGSQEVVQKAPRKKKQPQAVLTQERSANGDNRGAVGVTATAKKPPKKVQPAVRSIGAAKPTTEAKAKASGSEKVVAKKAEQSSKTAEQEKQKQATLSVREIAATVSAAPYTSGTESSSVRIANAKFVAVSLRKQRPSTLSYEEAEEEVRRLDEELRGHDYQYYVLDSPSLSDQKYDRLVRRAMELIKLHPGLGASFTKLSYVGAGGLSADLIDTTDAKNSSPKAGKNKKKARKKAVEAFLPYLHAQPMLSLDNAFTSEELQAFTNRCVQGLVSKPSANITASETSSAEDSVQYLMEPKIDGLSLSLIYQLEQKDSSKSSRTKKGVKGRSLVWSLKLAGTRGDGQIGEEVTANVLHFLPSLPKQIHLPAAAVEKASKSMPLEDLVVDVRGEAYLSRPNFAAINLEREKRGLTTFTTARNGAAGILRRRYYDSGSTNSNGTDANKQDMEYVLTGGEEKYERRLSFFAYGLNYRIAKSATVAKAKGEPLDEILPESQAEVLEDLQQMGFDVARLRLPDSDKNNDKALSLFSREQLWDECVRLVDVRTELPYDTDGVVIKVNSRKQQEALGVATRFPRWAIAVKLDSQSAVTVLKDIVVQVGRTGVLTPVAVLDPVEIGGVVVERATLHNEREINRLGLYVGATVSVMRAGDVIPKIVGIANSSVRGSRTDGVSVKEADYSYSLPQHCPVCHSPTVRECTPEPSSKLSGNRSESELLRNSATRVKCTGGRWVCAAQAVELISHYCSRDAMDIPNLSSNRIQNLYELGLLKKASDLYRLPVSSQSIVSMESTGSMECFEFAEGNVTSNTISLEDATGWDKKSVQNLLTSVNSAKSAPFDRFLYGLGVPHVGLQTARDIARKAFLGEGFQDFWLYLQQEAAKLLQSVKSLENNANSTTQKSKVDEVLKNNNVTVAQLESWIEEVGKEQKSAARRKKKSGESVSETEDNEKTKIGERLKALNGLGNKALASLLLLAVDKRASAEIDAMLSFVEVHAVDENGLKKQTTNQQTVNAEATVGNTNASIEIVENLSLTDTAFPLSAGNSKKMNGKVVLFTGKLSVPETDKIITRQNAEKIITELGGEVRRTMTNDVNLLVASEIATGNGKKTKKAEAAEKRGIEVWSNADFFGYLDSMSYPV